MPACIVCQAEVPSSARLFETLLRCPECGFVFAAAQPSEDDHRRLYQRAYFFGDEYADYLDSREALQRNFRQRIRTLARCSAGGRLFEIGSAYGFFLELAQPRWQVEGIDIAREGCAFARERLGLNVRCGDFLETPLPPASFDVFCLWDTVEHLLAPDRYLEKIAGHLRSGGHLALTTGDIGSLSARLQGRRWRLIHPPTHLYYFSAHTMARFLDRFGFEVVHLSHPGFYRSLSALATQSAGCLGKWGRALCGRMQRVAWRRKALYINLFDIMYVVARKR